MFESHPGRQLSNHIEDVRVRAQFMLEQMSIFENQVEWERFVHIIALSHDFGKYTSFFQRHLKGESLGNETRHSLLGALFGAYVIEHFNSIHCDKTDIEYYTSLFVYFIIIHHHLNLSNFAHFYMFEKDKPYPYKYSYLALQLKDIESNMIKIQQDQKSYAPDLASLLKDFVEDIELHIEKLRKKIIFFNRRFIEDMSEDNITLCVKLQMSFSLLIDADKHSAAKTKKIERLKISADLVQSFRDRKFTSTLSKSDAEMNGRRNLVRNIVLENVSKANLAKFFFTFTSPTGTGKTLTALEGALRLRERLKKEEATSRRIIYVLPFTSIIDQNYKVLEEVICPDGLDHRLLLKHHYLSEIEYNSKVDEHEPLDKQLMFIESWESEIIVTTYVQLMHTMLSGRNRQLKKLHNLAGAIVIMDEVQNIPFQYWKLTSRLCEEYSRQFDNKWILLTATQPHIFPKAEAQEWLEDKTYKNSYFFEQMERTEIQLKSEQYIGLDEWLSEAEIIVGEASSALLILNTIATSKEVYQYFEAIYGESVYYLSANLISRHRKKILKKVRKSLEKKLRVILVSTQVVEAGVDLDFQTVIRDLGPMDSIIQAAGRCNRHNKRKKERVYILPLKKEEKRASDASMIYGIDADLTLQTLRKFHNKCGKCIPESLYQRMVDTYYQILPHNKEDDESTKRIKQMRNLEFEELDTFTLIPQKGEVHPVFIMYNKTAECLWEFYVENVWKEKDLKKKRNNYLRCKAKLKEFQMDVANKYRPRIIPECGFFVIRREWLESGQYYNAITGWIRDPKDEDTFWI